MTDEKPDTAVPGAVLASWLRDKGYAEECRGYGHVEANDLADALMEQFDIRYKAGAGKDVI